MDDDGITSQDPRTHPQYIWYVLFVHCVALGRTGRRRGQG